MELQRLLNKWVRLKELSLKAPSARIDQMLSETDALIIEERAKRKAYYLASH